MFMLSDVPDYLRDRGVVVFSYSDQVYLGSYGAAEFVLVIVNIFFKIILFFFFVIILQS